MALVKLRSQEVCYKCAKEILSGEPGYKTKIGYMHFYCGYKVKKPVN